MSASPIAAFRTGPRDELRKLEEEHLQHDLQQSDRDALRSAATKLSTHATIGSLAGIGLGLFLALRVRNARKLAFRAFQTAEKPTHLQFADGRTAPIPSLEGFLKPTTAGDIAAMFFFSAGGLFVGGELGILTGTYAANRTISRDLSSKARIAKAYASFKADLYQKEAERLRRGDLSAEQIFGGV